MVDGRAAMRRGEYEEAARIFGQVAEAHPEEPGPWMALGRAEMAAERFARARAAFEHVVSIRPAAAGPRILVGHTHELERDYELALDAYLGATEHAPESARAWRVLGTRLLRWGRAADAIAPLERAVALAPEHHETRNALATARYHAEDGEGAEREFLSLIADAPDYLGGYLGLAAIRVNAHRFEDALGTYDLVVGRWPGMAAAWVGRGILLHQLGRREEALASFEEAARVGADHERFERRLESYRQLLEAEARGEVGPAPEPDEDGIELDPDARAALDVGEGAGEEERLHGDEGEAADVER